MKRILLHERRIADPCIQNRIVLLRTNGPEQTDAIGGTVDESIKILQNDAEAINDALSSAARATAEDTADGEFGNPVLDSSDPWGDWNVDQDMGDAAGACD